MKKCAPRKLEVVTHSEYAAAAFEINSQCIWNNSVNKLELNLKSDFGFTTCVHKSDIKSVLIVPVSSDRWNVNTVVTLSVCVHCSHKTWILTTGWMQMVVTMELLLY